MIKKNLILFLFVAILAVNFKIIYAQTALSSLKSAVDALKNDYDLQNASLSILIKENTSGKTITSLTPKRALAPASSMKTITTSTALSILGANYQFKTQLQYSGSIENGILNGNIYIKGGGDPSLGSTKVVGGKSSFAILKIWVEAVKKLGITKINGKIIADATIFEEMTVPYTWQWNDIGNYYGAGASGLSFMDNTYQLFFKSGAKEGNPTTLLKFQPQIPGLQFSNQVKTGKYGSGDNAYIFGSPYTYFRYVNGTIPPNKSLFSIKGSIPDPAYYAAYRLHYALKNAGISVSQSPSSVRILKSEKKPFEKNRKTFHTTSSPPLSAIVQRINVYSDNLYAEHLLKYLGWYKLKKGNLESGKKVVESFGTSIGLNLKGFYMEDGCGLSRQDAVSAEHFVNMLQKISKSGIYTTFFNSLPIAGKTGTMKYVCGGTTAQGRVFAKSGYMTRVLSYVGYVKSVSGKTYTFALLVNNYNCKYAVMKKKFEKIMVKIAQL